MTGAGPCFASTTAGSWWISRSTRSRAPIVRAFSIYIPRTSREYHQQLRKNGLTIPDLDVTFYGMTEFRFDDPDGNRLWIGEVKGG